MSHLLPDQSQPTGPMSMLPEAARSTLSAIGARKESGAWRCPYCQQQIFHADMEGECFYCLECCGRMQSELRAWDFYTVLSRARRGEESLVQHCVPGVVARRAETSVGWTVAGPLLVETVSKLEVQKAIDRHHEHHESPNSAILGVRCVEQLHTDDQKLRGVGTLSTPTARELMEQGTHLEVNRLCTWGPQWRRHNVISRVSGQLRKEARRLRREAQEALEDANERTDACAKVRRRAGIERLRTYVLASESGTSLRAAGWHLVGRSGGGSWAESRDGRKRSPKTEGAKWVYDTPL